MDKHEFLKFSLDDHLDINFAADLLSQLDLKRLQLHSPNNDDLLMRRNEGPCDLKPTLESEDDNMNTLSLDVANDPIRESTSIGTEHDTKETPSPWNHAAGVTPAPATIQTPPDFSQHPLSPAMPNPPQQHSLLRRSSAYLNQKFKADGAKLPPSPPLQPASCHENRPTVESSAPAFPCQYPPSPLHYSPVYPPNDRHRASFPWRKKSTTTTTTSDPPRRKSEPGRIKGRRSFFF
ncbi:hypothetical protein [Absidia glauca]|uniref:Uncharacterized protein n=1 Tax=Absidia glauca TaxID=4829 RepID=A0A163JIE9_ABSGL|nr:hypothetical protein [Absidia glauca]